MERFLGNVNVKITYLLFVSNKRERSVVERITYNRRVRVLFLAKSTVTIVSTERERERTRGTFVSHVKL